MKKEIHPENQRKVIFVDDTSGAQFLVDSTVKTSETGKWEDGQEYPLFHIEISSASHPFYTGEKRIVRTGAVDRFNARLAAKDKK